MVAILSPASVTGPPQTDDMRIQPNPSLDTSGPFLPRAIFLIAVITVILWSNDTKIGDCTPWPISSTAQFTCLDGSRSGSKLRDDNIPVAVVLVSCKKEAATVNCKRERGREISWRPIYKALVDGGSAVGFFYSLTRQG